MSDSSPLQGVLKTEEALRGSAAGSRTVRISSKSLVSLAILFVTVRFAGWAYGEEPPVARDADAEVVSLEVARDRAKLLHRVYAATLDAMHHHYFQANRSVLPARAMEDIFAELSDQSQIEARWISVNTPAMSVSHEPKTEFEKKAAEVIAAGNPFHEQVEKGTYSRAAPIPLTGGCVNCHVGFFKEAGERPRFAGLVIHIPVQESKRQP